MPSVTCPTCGNKLQVTAEELGGSIHCQDCARSFRAEDTGGAPPKPARTDLVREESFERERPSRRHYEPHRGGMIVAFGVVGILVGGVGFVTGILAWIWGNEDLKKMDAGVMDPAGRSNTQLGKVLGMIGTILHAISLVIGLLFMCLFSLAATAVLGWRGRSHADCPDAYDGEVGHHRAADCQEV
jgi:hypothetical protein